MATKKSTINDHEEETEVPVGDEELNEELGEFLNETNYGAINPAGIFGGPSDPNIDPIVGLGQGIARIREKIDFPAFDSILYPEKLIPTNGYIYPYTREPNGIDRFRLFYPTNIGLPELTNLATASCFPADQTFIATGLYVKFWTDNPMRWTKEYPLIEAVALYEVVVGVKTQFRGDLKFCPLSSEQDRIVTLEHKFEKTIQIPARQNFGVNVSVPSWVTEEIKKQMSDGFRFLWRIILDGSLTRDIQ